MGRKRTNYPDTFMRDLCNWLQRNVKQNWHPLNNPLTFLFSLKKAVSITLWHVCTNIYTIFVPWGFVHVHIYFYVGGCCLYYYSFPDENKHKNKYGLWESCIMCNLREMREHDKKKEKENLINSSFNVSSLWWRAIFNRLDIRAPGSAHHSQRVKMQKIRSWALYYA